MGERQECRPVVRPQKAGGRGCGVTQIMDRLSFQTVAGVQSDHYAQRHVLERHRVDVLRYAAIAEVEIGGRQAAERTVANLDENIDPNGLGRRLEPLLGIR